MRGFLKSRWTLVIISLLIFFLSVFPTPPISYTAGVSDYPIATSGDSTIKLNVIFAGDAMVHKTQIKSAYMDDKGGHDFHPVFDYIKPVLSHGALNVINLETTLAGKPYRGYPVFSAPDTFAYALKDAGFNILALANNHSVDRGKNGLLRTLDVLEAYDYPSFGTYRDSADRAERYPLLFEYSNIKVGLLNYTYGTNGIPVPEPTIVNMIDTALIRQDIAAAREMEADFIIIYFHWGAEYVRQPNNEQKALATFSFQAGADMVIGTHPHVVQPIELLDVEIEGDTVQRWVAWSLGNFVSNQRKEHTDGGVMLMFTIKKNIYNQKVSVANMSYLPYWVYRPLNPTLYYVLPVALLENNDTLFPEMSEADKNAFSFFARETRAHLNKIEDSPLIEFKLY